MKKYRMVKIVPSSNITMETEIPAIFRSEELYFQNVYIPFK
jgi:maleate isomerase